MQPLGVTLFRQCARCRLCALWAVSTSALADHWRGCLVALVLRPPPAPRRAESDPKSTGSQATTQDYHYIKTYHWLSVAATPNADDERHVYRLLGSHGAAT